MRRNPGHGTPPTGEGLDVSKGALVQENVATRKDDRWGSPRELMNLLREEFPFDVDLAAECASCQVHKEIDGALEPRYFGPDSPVLAFRDALAIDWRRAGKVGFLNPPFSLLEKFMVKVVEEKLAHGFSTVALLPVKTETRWWHFAIPFASEVRFLKGRLSYVDPEGGAAQPARFASCVVLWDGTFRPKGLSPREPTFSHWDWRVQ